MTSASAIKSMASSLQGSIDAAMKKLQTQLGQEQGKQTGSSAKVDEFQQDVRKSSVNVQATATNIGVLIKDASRLNVMSSLGANDAVDFYKMKVTSDGAMALGRAGDTGVRLQLMDKTGNVLADSDEQAGAAYDAYKKLQAGGFEASKGDYTIRVSRAAGEKAGEAKNYAFQFTQGGFTKDYDTIARQPAANGAGGASSGRSYLDILRNNGASSTNLNILGSSNALSLLGSGAARGSLLNTLL